MPISYKPETGEAWSLSQEGRWEPTKVAKNAQTGETFALDGAEWKLIPAEKPAEKPAAPERSLLGEVNHIVGGVADAAASAIPFSDEMAAGVRAGARYLTDNLGITEPRKIGIADLIKREATGQGPPPSNYERALEDIRGRDKQFAEEHPYLSAGGKVAGGLTMGKPTVSTAWAPATVAAPVARSTLSTIARSGVTGAGYGGVSGFADGEGGFQNRLNSAVDGAITGGLFGAAVPAIGGVASRVVSPFRNQLTPEAQRLAAVARAEGIPLSAAQATGSRPLQSLEAFFETHPLTAGKQQMEMQQQRTAFNRAALRHIEETGDDLSPATLTRARARIGGEIENLASQVTVAPDAKFVTDLADTVSQYSRRLDGMKKPVFDTFVDDIKKMMQAGGMPGATYQSTRSTLSSMSNSARNSDPYFAKALRELRKTLDDAADRAMPTHLKGAWRKAHSQWGNLRTLEKAMDNTTTGAAAGNLQPTQLSLNVRQGGPMEDLAGVGTSFVRPQIPNSGTPERLFWQNMMTNPVAALGTAGVGASIDPLTTAGVIGAGLVGPKLGQMFYRTPLVQGYVKNQRMAGVAPAVRQGLLSGFAGAAGGGLLGP
jgi:hypothetical protein